MVTASSVRGAVARVTVKGGKKKDCVYGVGGGVMTCHSMVAPSFPEFLLVCQGFPWLPPDLPSLLNLHILGTHHPSRTKCALLCVLLSMGVRRR